MMDYIRNNTETINDRKGATIIYGLDTDLFLLALLIEQNNLYIWRQPLKDEPQDARPGNGRRPRQESTREQFPKLVNIGKSRSFITEKLGLQGDMRLIHDFVAYTSILGNDFIPRHPALEDFQAVVKLLMDKYKEFQKDIRRLTEESPEYGERIVWRNMLRFLKTITLEEPSLLRDQYGNKFLAPSPGLKAAVYQVNDENVFDYAKYRDAYYQHLFRMESEFGGKRDLVETPMQTAMIKDMVTHYLEAINFLYTYYIYGGDAVSKSFYYPYHYAPMLADILNVGVTVITSVVENEVWGEQESDYLHPLHLLAAVLSIKSSSLYTKSIKTQIEKKRLTDKAWDLLFPDKVIRDVAGQVSDTHAPILVPFVDPNLIKSLTLPRTKAEKARWASEETIELVREDDGEFDNYEENQDMEEEPIF